MQAQTMEDENVSLREEVCKLREREAATREILAVISQNRDDERPVLDAITRNAVKLCDATGAGLWLLSAAGDVTRLESVAQKEGKSEFSVGLEFPRDNISPMGQCYRDSRTINIADIRDDPYYLDGDPIHVKMTNKVGIRSRLLVPLIQNGIAFGCISLVRIEVRAFSDAEVTLIESFAKQAVIAIENVRQFREVQTRLEREEASREILHAISASRTDPAPVFDVILRNAAHLSGAPLANLCLLNDADSHWHLVAHFGDGLRHLSVGKTATPLDSELVPAVAMRTARVVHIEDLTDTDLYRQGDPGRIAMIEVEGMRTILCVPILREDTAIGCITLFRREVKAFTSDEIILVETFAAQAVIAIENVRQFLELETLNAELGDRVKEQVVEIERIGKLKRFLPAAVADAVISSGSEKMLSSHRALLGVLFCDIRGFTAFCETAEPEETIEVLQTYHQEMGKLINAYGAGVDHRMGDGIMVLFNDPMPCDDPAGDAVRLAIAMRAKMAELSKQWKRLGYRLGFGVAVSLGYATVGIVGYEGRFDYTASGTAINLAARLCDEAEDGEILLSPRAAVAVEDNFPTEAGGALKLKGIREPVEILRLGDISLNQASRT